MAFIKIQKLKYNGDGTIKSGSASIVESKYVRGEKNHSRQVVRERLGKIISLSSDKKSGVFLSPTRGLIEYDSKTDSFSTVPLKDSRLSDRKIFAEPEIHTVFGDSYLFLCFLKNEGILDILRTVFPKNRDYERILCHAIHGILKDGSRSSCDGFLAKSFASYLLTDVPQNSLHSDTRFSMMMGDDKTKIKFFTTFVKAMRRKDPQFGKGCYVDSTPLPNDITDNPFNALSCHGVASSSVQIRLALVLDEKTGLPVWYDIIPGNVLDISTISNIINDVAESVDVEIDSLILDAGYVSRELIQTFHNGSEKYIIGRMPARRGYPFKTMYWEEKGKLFKGKYRFMRNKHTYFGVKRKIELFNQELFAYIYLDQNNALAGFQNYYLQNEEEYEAMKDRDKDWLTVKYGYFVLISNKDETPKDLLTEYFERTQIESVFKTSKDYLKLLPLSKWTDQTVRGKILHDIINTIILLTIRKFTLNTGASVSSVIERTQSLMCCKTRSGNVNVEMPSKQCKHYYDLFNVSIPSSLNIEKFKKEILL